jgi:rRNA pseudouridine-1189 N-methylase Emg1 (Nep1/Mra1 family)
MAAGNTISFICTQLLCIRENSFKKESDSPLLKVYSNALNRLAILLDSSGLDELIEELEKNDQDKFRVYVFSLANEDFSEELSRFAGRVQSLPIPEGILNTYFRNLGEIKGRA